MLIGDPMPMIAPIIPEWNELPPEAAARVGAMSTTRGGGVSRAPYDDGMGGGGLNLGLHVGDRAEDVLQNRALLRACLPDEPAWLTQIHGPTVLDAAKLGGAPEADASIATRPGVVCAIQTADCLPVLFCDARANVIGAAHAGWRGLAAGVLENTIASMRGAGAEEIFAWMGPAIGPACFEVGADVFTVFSERSADMRSTFVPVQGRSGKYFADIYGLARIVLENAGVVQVSGGGLCTFTDDRSFYSYRRDKTTGRMASLIWLKHE
jgi:YfiH family protein